MSSAFQLESGTANNGRDRELSAGSGQGCTGNLTRPTRLPDQGEVFYEDCTGTGDLKGSVANLVNSAAGAGMLGLPYAYQCCGAVLASVLLVIFGIIIVYSLHLVGRAQKFANALTYQECVQRLIGPKAAICIIMLQLLSLVGGCIGFLCIIPDQLVPVFSDLLGPQSMWANRGFLIGIIALFIIMPLMFVRNIAKLWPLAMFSIVAVVYATGLIIVRAMLRMSEGATIEYVMGEPKPFLASQLSLCRYSPDIFKAIPIFCYAYNVHTIYPLVFGELSQPKRLSRMDRASGISVFICFMVYACCGWCGQVFGVASDHKVIPGDALLMFPSEVDVTIARFCIVASVVASFTALHFAARCCIQDLLKAYGFLSQDEFTQRQYALEIVVFLTFTIGVASQLQELDFVLGIVGCIACIPLMLVFPGLLQLKLDKGTDFFSLKQRGKGYVLIALGCVLSILGLVVTIGSDWL